MWANRRYRQQIALWEGEEKYRLFHITGWFNF